MSKTRKLLSVVLALTMVLSMFAVVANAANYYYEDEEEVANYNQNWSLAEPVDNGDGTYSVDVLLTTDYATGPIQFVLTNSDTSVAAIESATLGDAIPETYKATLSISKTKGKVMIIADSTNDATITAEAIDGVIATVVYTYAGSGSATIAIDNNAKSATNPGGTLIAARMSDGDVVTGDAITGQTVTVGASVVIGGGEPPVLSVIDGTIGVIDTGRTTIDADNGIECDGYLYGIDPYDAGETVDMIFEVVGDGEMEIIASDAGSEAGTGTMVNVLDLDGNVVASYILIVFGDVNGDGVADGADAGDIELHDAYMLNEDTGRLLAYQEFAGDVNGDGLADGPDAGDIELHDAYMLNDDTGRIVIADLIAML